MRARVSRASAGESRSSRVFQKPTRILPPLHALVEALEGRGELGVVGPEGEQLLEVGDGAVRLAGEVLGGLDRFLEQLDAALLVTFGSEQLVVEAEQVVPPPRTRQEHGESLEGPLRGGRVHPEHARQHVDELGRILAEPLLVELDRALGDGAHRIGVELALERLPVECAHLVRPLQCGGDVLEGVPHLLGGEVIADRFEGGIEALGRGASFGARRSAPLGLRAPRARSLRPGHRASDVGPDFEATRIPVIAVPDRASFSGPEEARGAGRVRAR